MEEGNGELAILKFSHFDGFNDDHFASLAEQVTKALGDWLFVEDPERRLVDIPLSELLGGAGKVVVVMDNVFFDAAEHRTAGILVYRDEQKCDAARGALRVFDHYSKTSSYPDMKHGQLEKFAGYDGVCHPKDDCAPAPTQSCDLFLLSWTLTPDDADYETYDMAEVMRTADRNLAAGIQEAVVPNARDRRINVVFLDYVDHARAVEVCLDLNGLL